MQEDQVEAGPIQTKFGIGIDVSYRYRAATFPLANSEC